MPKANAPADRVPKARLNPLFSVAPTDIASHQIMGKKEKEASFGLNGSDY